MSEKLNNSEGKNIFLEKAKIHSEDLRWFHDTALKNDDEINQAEEVFYRGISKLSKEIVENNGANGVDLKTVVGLYLLAPRTEAIIYKSYLSEILVQNGFSPLVIEGVIARMEAIGEIPSPERVLKEISRLSGH